jgi:hypothetical protein
LQAKKLLRGLHLKARSLETAMRSITLAVSIPLVLACDSVAPPTSWRPAERIAGSWQWVRSVDVNSGRTITPSDTGFSAAITFVATSGREGTYVFQRTGGESIRGSFSITSEDAPGNDFITVSASFPFITANAWVAAGSDSLHLGGVFERGFNSTYARVKQ